MLRTLYSKRQFKSTKQNKKLGGRPDLAFTPNFADSWPNPIQLPL